MATRSSIAILSGGQYIGVYCHFDGYLSYNGRVLLENYNTEEKVKELISFGNISSLGETSFPNPIKPHSFDDSQIGVSIFYHRDRGDKWETSKPIISNDESIFYFFVAQEYNYLFKDRCWYWNRRGEINWENGKPVWKLLTANDIDRSAVK